MKKEAIAIIAVAATHFTVNQALLAQQITIHLPKIPRIGKSNTGTGGDSTKTIGRDRISGSNERRQAEPADPGGIAGRGTDAFYGKPLTGFEVQ